MHVGFCDDAFGMVRPTFMILVWHGMVLCKALLWIWWSIDYHRSTLMPNMYVGKANQMNRSSDAMLYCTKRHQSLVEQKKAAVTVTMIVIKERKRTALRNRNYCFHVSVLSLPTTFDPP
jgi:hypothetical protein